MPSLLQRLKERKIVQWSIAYLAGSWVLIEVVSVLAEPFGLAVDPTTRALTLFLAWGFLGALVLAWFHAEKGRQSVTVLELALLGLIGVGGVSSAVASYRMGDLGSSVAASGRLESVLEGPVIAVLPFINASEAAEGAAFLASGIHGEILTHLSKLSRINAISRTSVASYQSVDRSLRQIAEELGASAILEGTVQRAGSLIRINVSLIDAVRDVQLWGDIYEGVLEPESVFALQGEIASRIADALAVVLAPEERSRLTQVPTTDPQAFELYLLGQEAEHRADRGEFQLYEVAYDYYRDALERDSLYAQAHAAIAGVEAAIYSTSRGNERTPEQLDRVRSAAERAIELDPELAHGHRVLGDYYLNVVKDAVRAQESFLRARRFDPDNVLALRGLAQLSMRDGDWDAARVDLRRASDLDPREPLIQMLAADLAFYMGRFDEAELLQRRLLGLAKLAYDGEWGAGGILKTVYQHVISTYLAADGDTDRAVDALNEMVAFANLTPRNVTGFLNDYYPRHPAPFGATLLRVDEVRDVVEGHPGFQERHFINIVAKAWLLRWAGEDPAEERRIWGVWGDMLVEAPMPGEQTAVEIRTYVAQMYARAGRSEDAWAQMAHAQEAADTILSVYYRMNAEPRWAMTLVELGEHEQALDSIEDMLSRPSALSVNLLNLQPEWDAIRDHPRFQALLEQYGS
jgi:TolB-like protein